MLKKLAVREAYYQEEIVSQQDQGFGPSIQEFEELKEQTTRLAEQEAQFNEAINMGYNPNPGFEATIRDDDLRPK